jgi:hypothetical protein
MIKKILEADDQTGRSLESYERLRIESAGRINEFLENRRTEYIKKARVNIKVIEKIENVKAESETDLLEERCKKDLEMIDRIYRENKEIWIKNIVNRVLRGNVKEVF